MNFTERRTTDHLYMLTEGYKHLTVDKAMQASVAELKYWMTLANCNACNIPGQTFEDLFSVDEVAQYRDMERKPLNELTFEFKPGGASERHYQETTTSKGRVEYQLNYVRWYLISRFAATLVNLFSTMIFSYRNELGGEMGEPPREWVNTPSPLLSSTLGQVQTLPEEYTRRTSSMPLSLGSEMITQCDGTAASKPAENDGDADVTQETAQEHFLRTAKELNTEDCE